MKPKKNPQNSERNIRTLFKNQENLENLKKKYQPVEAKKGVVTDGWTHFLALYVYYQAF